MPKNLESKPEEYFKAIIRHLKKENQALRRRVRELENRLAIVPEEDLDTSEVDYDIKGETCPECHKGIIIEITLVGRKFKKCDQCTYRTKAIKA